ncbi:unnamed protein product [Clavelina lepadiformis]|uniref:Vesicle-fusing ATPase n=1 Tax=Clavelina lepadiformis TaxID=159417 RepID=A0ABP0FQQ9_CLALP
MLLHGPPGCGKTLLARQIGKMLNAREPQIVNGPEILNKHVGESEENIRNLFEPAELEQEKFGVKSGLHIIIFDEIDAICKQRGSVAGSSGVNDSVVNQLLTKIDGMKPLNNILIIGMTNRRDMIDEALLRPGRLEVHLEIGLPDEDGRLQILSIHTQKMKDSQALSGDVDLENIAKLTANFTGAELAGLVRAALSRALVRHQEQPQAGSDVEADHKILVCFQDFEESLENDIKPAVLQSDSNFCPNSFQICSWDCFTACAAAFPTLVYLCAHYSDEDLSWSQDFSRFHPQAPCSRCEDRKFVSQIFRLKILHAS